MKKRKLQPKKRRIEIATNAQKARVRIRLKCKECGRQFTGYPYAKWCSNRCKQRVKNRKTR